MCDNPPSLPLEKVFYYIGQGGKITDLQKMCEILPSLLSQKKIPLLRPGKGASKMTDLTPLERERMTTIS